MPELEKLLSLLGWGTFLIAVGLDAAMLVASGRTLVRRMRRVELNEQRVAAAWVAFVGAIIVGCVFSAVAHFQLLAQEERKTEVLSYKGLSKDLDGLILQVEGKRIAFRHLIDVRELATEACLREVVAKVPSGRPEACLSLLAVRDASGNAVDGRK